MTRAGGAPGPWDSGLQIERSNLAWRRTALGLTAALALASRFLTGSHPWAGLVLPLAAVAAGGAVMAAAARRSGRFDRWLRAREAGEAVPKAPGGRLLFTAAVLAALTAVAGVCLVVSGYGPAGP